MSTHALADRHRPSGSDRFGILTERFARFFGTPQFIVGQTVIIIAWIIVNAAVVARMDEQHLTMLQQNTGLTEQVARLTQELHEPLVKNGPGGA